MTESSETLGVIQSIAEIDNVKFGRYCDGDGYRVTTDKHTFSVLIDNGQSCCENWGYFASNDDFEPFIGAELLSVEFIDEALNKKQFDELFKYGFDCGGAQFVDFNTSRGTLQLAVYNDHNGYYGHSIAVIKDSDFLLEGAL